MKKKAIENIPYLGLKKTSRKKAVKYIGVTAIKIIGNERHLFLEMYRNQKDSMDIPVVRIVLTKKDFGNYFPEKEKWTCQQIDGGEYYSGDLIWNNSQDNSVRWMDQKERSILSDATDMERIEKICKESGRYDNGRWWKCIARYEKDIVITARRKAEHRRYERRKAALNDRIAHTGPIPENKILERADNIFFRNKHYLYYKKHGSWAKVTCSKCGGVTDARWKAGMSYESQFQTSIEEPRENHYGNCPLCGTLGTWKCQGKVKGDFQKHGYLFLGQKYKEKGMVIRYVKVTKEWHLDFFVGEKGLEMNGAHEALSGVETARAYFEPGEKPQVDYHKNNCLYGDYWDDCNYPGMYRASIEDGIVMPETFDEMRETMFQYSALKEYAEKNNEINPIRYLQKYQKLPQLEMLVKMGLDDITEKILEWEYFEKEIVENPSARRPDEFLGIRKDRVRQLIKSGGNIALLKVMKIEKESQANWSAEQIEKLAETGVGGEQIANAINYMTLQKLLNRISKYAGCEYGTKCSTAEHRIKQAAITYTDYLNMRVQLGYDLTNTVYQQPHNLAAAHAKMVTEQNKEEMDKRIQEVNETFPIIRKRYRELREKYFYEDDDYVIRPARSAGEIVMEGRILHHCVGGNGYLQKHNNGKSYILMLRFRSEPEIPYITVEIDGASFGIIQWYGAHDHKPDEENMQQWLEQYLNMLREGGLKAGSKIETMNPTAAPVMMPA